MTGCLRAAGPAPGMPARCGERSCTTRAHSDAAVRRTGVIRGGAPPRSVSVGGCRRLPRRWHSRNTPTGAPPTQPVITHSSSGIAEAQDRAGEPARGPMNAVLRSVWPTGDDGKAWALSAGDTSGNILKIYFSFKILIWMNYFSTNRELSGQLHDGGDASDGIAQAAGSGWRGGRGQAEYRAGRPYADEGAGQLPGQPPSGRSNERSRSRPAGIIRRRASTLARPVPGSLPPVVSRSPAGGGEPPRGLPQSAAAQHSSDTLAPPPPHSVISRRKLCSFTMAATIASPRPWPASPCAVAPR